MYGALGNVTAQTDALGNKVSYSYTPEGWLEQTTKADGTQLRYAYDKTGNLLTQDVGEGQTIRSEYNDIGQMTVVSSPEGDIRYQYDERGFLVSVENARGEVVRYAYDERGNKTEMTYPDGQIVSYTYDEMNRMVSATSLDGEVTTYTYDAAGRRVQSASEQLTTVYEYDVLGNLTKQETTGQTAISFVYGYDARNSITGEVRTENGETTQSDYAYDPLGQLTAFTQSNGYAESYAYDKAGNMTQKVITPTGGAQGAAEAITLTMKYNKGNQLTQMSHGKDSLTYAYDKNGNMTQKALRSKAYGKLTDSYAYNAQDMLTGYSGYDGFTQVFTYDASGMRLTKQEAGNENRSTLEELLRGEVAGLPEVVAPSVEATKVNPGEVLEGYEWATTEYLYDITAEYYQVIGETVKDKNGSTTTAYAYGIERIAAYNEGGKTSYVYDGRGSVAQSILTTPEAPTPQVQSYAYTAFGEQLSGVKASGFTYNAEAYDAKTGMLNLRARQYEPAMNRFSQKDILRGDVRNPLSLNRYAYVQSNPQNMVDKDGLKAMTIADYRKLLENPKLSLSMMRYYEGEIHKLQAQQQIKSAKSAADSKNLEALKDAASNLEYYTRYMDETTLGEYKKLQAELKKLRGSNVVSSDLWRRLQSICNNIYTASGTVLDDWSNNNLMDSYKDIVNTKQVFIDMYENRHSYPPQIQELLERYAKDVIAGRSTTLLTVSIKESDGKTQQMVKNKLDNFFAEYKKMLRPQEERKENDGHASNVDSSHKRMTADDLMAIFESTGNLTNLYGNQTTISEQDWMEYANFIQKLIDEKRIWYPEKSDKTSLKKKDGMLLVDCQGLNNLAMRLFLSEEAYNAYAKKTKYYNPQDKKTYQINFVNSLTGQIGWLLEDMQKKNPDVDIIRDVTYTEDKDGLTVFNLDHVKSGDVLLIDFGAEKPGYDHVVTVIADYEFPDGTKGVAVINSPVPGEPVEIKNAQEYLSSLIKNGTKISEIKVGDYYAVGQ